MSIKNILIILVALTISNFAISQESQTDSEAKESIRLMISEMISIQEGIGSQGYQDRSLAGIQNLIDQAVNVFQSNQKNTKSLIKAEGEIQMLLNNARLIHPESRDEAIQ